MGDYIGIRNFCSLCRHSEKDNRNIVCKNKESTFYNLSTKGILCAPCFSKKELKEDTKVEYVGFGD